MGSLQLTMDVIVQRQLYIIYIYILHFNLYIYTILFMIYSMYVYMIHSYSVLGPFLSEIYIYIFSVYQCQTLDTCSMDYDRMNCR